MKVLIVEDDLMCRTYMQKIMQPFAEYDIAVNGQEAVNLFKKAVDAQQYYNLVLLDINLPILDGQQVLQQIRAMETEAGIAQDSASKVVMTTALSDNDNIMKAFENMCEGYIVKPFRKEVVISQLRALGFDISQ